MIAWAWGEKLKGFLQHLCWEVCELNKGEGSKEKEVKCSREKSVGFGNWVQRQLQGELEKDDAIKKNKE